MPDIAHLEINHSDVPIRLFKSDFLEFFTHISPLVVLAMWGPVALYFLISSILAVPAGGTWLHIPAGLALGVFLWSFTEYTMHRFVFHFNPRNHWQERASFLFHGVHHAQPQCKTRLVMPLPVSVPLSLVFFGLFHWVFGALIGAPQWMAPSFAGFILGYLTYDMTHYATHHFPMRQGYLKFLKRYHMQHHYKTPNKRFGVSSPVWDIPFGTYLK
jgi:sterol desaturase/sphingolipid hydroxylase (fatty acid hydroxylase superfamily)